MVRCINSNLLGQIRGRCLVLSPPNWAMVLLCIPIILHHQLVTKPMFLLSLRSVHLVSHHLIDALLFLLFFILGYVKVSWLDVIVIHDLAFHQIRVQMVLALQFDPFDDLVLAIFLHELAIHVTFFLFYFLYDPYDISVVVNYFIIYFYLLIVCPIPTLKLGSFLLFSPLPLVPIPVSLLVYFLELLSFLLFSQCDQSLFLC